MRAKKGFTLIELMVAMGVIAVLIGMSVFGIQSVLRSQRDTERSKAADNIRLSLQSYFNAFADYPSTTDLTRSETEIIILNEQANFEKIPLTGSQKGAEYCYEYVTDQGAYNLAVKLENDQWKQYGNAVNSECGETELVD